MEPLRRQRWGDISSDDDNAETPHHDQRGNLNSIEEPAYTRNTRAVHRSSQTLFGIHENAQCDEAGMLIATVAHLCNSVIMLEMVVPRYRLWPRDWEGRVRFGCHFHLRPSITKTSCSFLQALGIAGGLRVSVIVTQLWTWNPDAPCLYNAQVISRACSNLFRKGIVVWIPLYRTMFLTHDGSTPKPMTVMNLVDYISRGGRTIILKYHEQTWCPMVPMTPLQRLLRVHDPCLLITFETS